MICVTVERDAWWRSASNPHKYYKGDADMKVREVIEGVQQQKVVQVLPTAVKQQARVGAIVGQIAASDNQRPPTEFEKVMAFRRYCDLRKQTDANYAARLQQQLALAKRKS